MISWKAVRGLSRPPDQEPSTGRLLASSVVLICLVILGWYLIPGVAADLRASFCAAGDPACATYALPPATTGGCTVITHARSGGTDVAFAQDVGEQDGIAMTRVVDREAVVRWFVFRRPEPGTPMPSVWDPKTSPARFGGGLAEFPSEQAAREHITALRHTPVRAALAGADPTGVLNRLGRRIEGVPQAPEADQASFVETAGVLPLDAVTTAGVWQARTWTGLIGTTGVTRARDGAQTVYGRLDASALTALGLLRPTAGLLPALGGVISLELDAGGRPQETVIDIAGALPSRLGPPFGWAAPTVFAGLLAPGPVGIDRTFTGRMTLTLDLTAREGRRRTADALHAVGVPWLIADGTPDREPRAALKDWYSGLDSGQVPALATVTTYPPDTQARGLDVRGGLTMGAAVPDRSYFYQPGQGFVEWQRCTR